MTVAALMLGGSLLMVLQATPEPRLHRHMPPAGLEARQIPLPPGDWHELARVTEESEAAAVLVRVDGRDVDAAVLVRVNRLGRRAGWTLPAACQSADYLPRMVMYASDHDGACGYASFVDGTGPLTGLAIDPAWRAAMREAVDRGWNVPFTWLSATFRIVDPMDGLQLRYLFHLWPVAENRPPESAAWRRVQAERLETWMRAAAPRVSLGFRDRFRDRDDAALPDPALIDTSDHASKGEEPARSADSLRGLSARVVASLAEFGVLWAFIGNPVTASALAGAKFAVQGVTGMTHEIAWSWLAPAVKPTDLPGVGVETPLPR